MKTIYLRKILIILGRFVWHDEFLKLWVRYAQLTWLDFVANFTWSDLKFSITKIYLTSHLTLPGCLILPYPFSLTFLTLLSYSNLSHYSWVYYPTTLSYLNITSYHKLFPYFTWPVKLEISSFFRLIHPGSASLNHDADSQTHSLTDSLTYR